MFETPKIHEESRGRTILYVLGFLLANLVVKHLLVGINEGEYTDGILQLTVFQNRSGLYPPLYGALSWIVSLTGIDLEVAARHVSAFSSAISVIPVYLLARRIHGDSAARFSAIFYTLAPLSMRWSVRVMSDALFMCISTYSIYFLWDSWVALRVRTSRRRADLSLAAATTLGALAALTRYQGAFLAFLLLLPAVRYLFIWKRPPWVSLFALLPWVALPLWMRFYGFAHGGQFTSRTADTWIETAAAYVNLFESFVLISPYYFAYPIAFFALFGVLPVARQRSGADFLWLFSAWALILLLLQSAFGSFQYRYMLPLLPCIAVIAGAGAAHVERELATRRKQPLFSLLLIGSVLYLTFFTSALMIFQRQSFGDQRAAAEYINKAVPPGQPVFANEQYGTFFHLGCVKLSFWTGRKVEPILPYLEMMEGRKPMRMLPPGSVLLLSNAYGGDAYLDALERFLNRYYNVRVREGLVSTVLPLHDDIMAVPGTSQNPTGWVLRYTPQHFTTQVLLVESPRITPGESDRASTPTLQQGGPADGQG